jgi:hypothetical protein
MRIVAALALFLGLPLAAALTVTDLSPTPTAYSSTAPVGFPIKVRVQGAAAFSLATAIVNLSTQTTHSVNHPVTMSATTLGVREGRFNPSAGTKRLYEGCGFRVQHKVAATIAGVKSRRNVVANIKGNPYAQHVRLGGPHILPQEVVFPGVGGSVTVPFVSVHTADFIGVLQLQNGYDRILKITGASVTCGGQDCSSVPTPYISVRDLPPVTQELTCGDQATTAFMCTPEAGGLKAEAKFETDLGTLIVPFECGPEVGGG